MWRFVAWINDLRALRSSAIEEPTYISSFPSYLMPQCPTQSQRNTIFFCSRLLTNTLPFCNINCHVTWMNEFKTGEGEMTFQVRINEVSNSILRPFLRQYCDLSTDRILCPNSGDCGHQGNSSTLLQPKLLVCVLVGRGGGFLSPFSRMENNLSTGKWWWGQREGNQESKGRWKFQMPLLNWSMFLGSLP